MTKHPKNSDHLQTDDLPKTTTVEIPLPLLGAFSNIENPFFGLHLDAGPRSGVYGTIALSSAVRRLLGSLGAIQHPKVPDPQAPKRRGPTPGSTSREHPASSLEADHFVA